MEDEIINAFGISCSQSGCRQLNFRNEVTADAIMFG